MCRGDAGGSRVPPMLKRRCPSPATGELMATLGDAAGTGDTVRGDSGNSVGIVDRCGAAGDRIGGIWKSNLGMNGCDGDVGQLRCRL